MSLLSCQFMLTGRWHWTAAGQSKSALILWVWWCTSMNDAHWHFWWWSCVFSTKAPTLHFFEFQRLSFDLPSLHSSISQVDTSANTCRMYISKSIHNHWALLTLNKTAHWTLHILPLNRIVWPCLFCQKTTSINTFILLACYFLSKTELDFSSFFLGDFYRNRYFFSCFFITPLCWRQR